LKYFPASNSKPSPDGEGFFFKNIPSKFLLLPYFCAIYPGRTRAELLQAQTRSRYLVNHFKKES